MGVVGDEEDGLAAFFVLAEEDVHDGASGGGVEVAGGFVGEEEGGLIDEGAGDGDALAFAAGELVGAVFEAGFEAEGGEEGDGFGFGGPGADDGFVEGGADHGGEEGVFEDGEFGEEVVELEDEAEGVVAEVGAGPAGGVFEGLSAEEDAAGVGGVEGAGDMEEGGFAGAGGAHDGDEFALVKGEGDAAEDLEADGAHLVGLGDVEDLEEGFGGGRHGRGRGAGGGGGFERLGRRSGPPLLDRLESRSHVGGIDRLGRRSGPPLLDRLESRSHVGGIDRLGRRSGPPLLDRLESRSDGVGIIHSAPPGRGPAGRRWRRG